MISLVGFSGLIFSYFFSLIILISYFYYNNKYIKKIFNYSVYLGVLSILISFFSLLIAYINSDFSNFNVFQNSHSSKPILYKITGTWGNHEGSMLSVASNNVFL